MILRPLVTLRPLKPRALPLLMEIQRRIGAHAFEATHRAIADAIEMLDTNLLCIHDASAAPVPAALWLFGTGLIGLIGIARNDDFGRRFI